MFHFWRPTTNVHFSPEASVHIIPSATARAFIFLPARPAHVAIWHHRAQSSAMVSMPKRVCRPLDVSTLPIVTAEARLMDRTPP
jgi:hypothetical protein